MSAARLSCRCPVTAADSPAYGVRAALSRAVKIRRLPATGAPAEYFGPAVRQALQELPGPPVLPVAKPLHCQLLRHFTWPCRYGAAVCLRGAVCRSLYLKSSRHCKGAGVGPRLPQALVLIVSSHRSPAATRPAVPVLPPASKRWLLTTSTRGHNSWWCRGSRQCAVQRAPRRGY